MVISTLGTYLNLNVAGCIAIYELFLVLDYFLRGDWSTILRKIPIYK